MSGVLYLCNRNAIRSPMAAALHARVTGEAARSAGLDPLPVDPFAVAVMAELGIDLSDHESAPLADLPRDAADRVVCLSLEAYDAAQSWAAPGVIVEFWPTPDPSTEGGTRDERVESYRMIRRALADRIRSVFAV